MSERVFWDVDTQVDFMLPEGKLYVPGAETIAANLARLTDHAHASGIRIVASSDNHDPDDEELSDTPDFRDTFPPHCMRGTPGQARIPDTTLRHPLVIEPEDAAESVATRLASHAGDILFHKHYFDVFTNPHVAPAVQALGVSEVILYGVALDVCDRYAVEGLLDRFPEIGVSVVTDAVRALDEGGRAALLGAWEARGVTLVRTEEVLGR
ncbi:MAG: cysteine hydrolase [Gammaproteobacteria bacterium]|nr:cysteine hydrolase [Gammaproteobacteria bacterium]